MPERFEIGQTLTLDFKVKFCKDVNLIGEKITITDVEATWCKVAGKEKKVRASHYPLSEATLSLSVSLYDAQRSAMCFFIG
jgi:hypothetical protein